MLDYDFPFSNNVNMFGGGANEFAAVGDVTANITVIHKISKKKLRKTLGVYDGNVSTIERARFFGEICATVQKLSLKDLAAALQSDRVLILGVPEHVNVGQQLTFISRKQFKAMFPLSIEPYRAWMSNSLLLTRTLDNMAYAPSSFILLDFDSSNATPSHLRVTNASDLLQILSVILPEFATTSFAVSYSSSAGIYSQSGEILKDLGKFHVYFIVDDSTDIPRFKNVMQARLIEHELFWYELDKAGNKKLKTLLDLSVFSPERVIFETSPVLNDSLIRNVPHPEFVKRQNQTLNTSMLKGTFSQESLLKIAQINNVDTVVTQKIKKGFDIDVLDVVVTKRDYDKLNDKTLIELADGSKKTCYELKQMLHNETITKTISCHAFDRVDRNPSCFVSLTADGRLFLHDMSTKITFYCDYKPAKKIYPLNVLLPANSFPYSEYNERTGKTSLLGVAENFQHLLDLYDIKVRYNLISRKKEYEIKDYQTTIDNKNNVLFNNIKNLAVKNGLPCSSQTLNENMLIIADNNAYNPAKDWILSHEWDGLYRFDSLCDTLTVPTEYREFRNIALRKWLLGATAAAFENEGVKFEYVLVFIGKQGKGKTTWFKKLAPPSLISDGVILETRDKDSKIEAYSYWLVELGELDATFKKSDIASLKALLSRSIDNIRKPYDIDSTVFVRRTVFSASVNEELFLADTTGNRRFWTIKVNAINFNHNIDMQQVFAEIYERFYDKEDFFLSAHEEAIQARLADKHKLADPIHEMILNTFDMDNAGFADYGCFMNATDIAKKIGILNPHKGQLGDIKRVLIDVFNIKTCVKANVNVYYMPPVKMIE
jgi:putative DNA primase/helicase